MGGQIPWCMECFGMGGKQNRSEIRVMSTDHCLYECIEMGRGEGQAPPRQGPIAGAMAAGGAVYSGAVTAIIPLQSEQWRDTDPAGLWQCHSGGQRLQCPPLSSAGVAGACGAW